MKPWLLEVNFNPALGLDCGPDHEVKPRMLQDLVSLLGYGEADRRRGAASDTQGRPASSRAKGAPGSRRPAPPARATTAGRRARPPSAARSRADPAAALASGDGMGEEAEGVALDRRCGAAKVGGFVRTFPFNAAGHAATNCAKADVRSAVREVSARLKQARQHAKGTPGVARPDNAWEPPTPAAEAPLPGQDGAVATSVQPGTQGSTACTEPPVQ